MEKKPDAYYISIEQLSAGIYVHLDLRWVEHNFSLNSFKIRNARQIDKIKALGFKKIRIDPARSVHVPPPLQETDPSPIVESGHDDTATVDHTYEVNPERLEFINQHRSALGDCERQFAKAASSLKDINANLHARPQEAYVGATDLVQDILATILSDKDVAIHLMNDKLNGEETYYHALNVAVLAMILAKEVGLPPSDIEQLGIGCLFHDIGKTQIPDRILRAEAPTRAEYNLLQQHCGYGSEIASKMAISRQAKEIILQHHEHADGSGYPNMLIGDEISPLARIAAIVNAYDNHCNQPNPVNSLTPYEALSHMYANDRRLFDAAYLSVFVRCMGVYPPGTLVRLSDQTLGMVVAVNFGLPLRPRILIFDPEVPKNEATVLDLQKETDLSVKDSLRPADISREVYDYLSPRTRMAYFFETPKRGPSR
jgi:putative nucleotidyltransferase with HDIG domain